MGEAQCPKQKCTKRVGAADYSVHNEDISSYCRGEGVWKKRNQCFNEFINYFDILTYD